MREAIAGTQARFPGQGIRISAQAHLLGMGILRVLSCPSCGRGSEYENSPRGWIVRMLAKRPVQQVPQGQQRK